MMMSPCWMPALAAGLAGRDLGHQDPRRPREPELLLQFGGHRLGAHAQIGVGGLAGLDDLVGDLGRHHRRDGEADVHGACRPRRQVGHVDADHLAARRWPGHHPSCPG